MNSFLQDDFPFPNNDLFFLSLDGGVPLAPSYGAYISQLVRYVLVCSDVFGLQ